MTRTVFPQYQNASGWNSLLPPRTDVTSLTGEVAVDVAVIGAGYTGIAAARRWAARRSQDALAVLDATTLGEGSPGRNSGFLLEIALASDADSSNLTRMREANRLISSTMNTLRDDVFDAGIDCEIERAGTYRAAAGKVGARALAAYRRFLNAASLPHERLSGGEIEERLGTAYYREGLYSPNCYLVQPAALIRGLAGLLPDSVKLFEDTPAISVRRDQGLWSIKTPNGTLRCAKVLVANNAFAKGLGLAPSRLSTMYTYAGLTEPLPAEMAARLGSDSSWGLLPTHRLGCTLRRTRDDRLLIRSHYGYEREDDNEQIARQLLNSLHKRFPSLQIKRFASVWAGATGFTMNGAPVWGELRDGLFVSAGCNGGGVVKGTLFGELLADLALGRDVPDIPSLFGKASWMPPEPLRRLGFEIVSRFEKRQARAEM